LDNVIEAAQTRVWMLLGTASIAWLIYTTVLVAACRAAARGDRMLEAEPGSLR